MALAGDNANECLGAWPLLPVAFNNACVLAVTPVGLCGVGSGIERPNPGGQSAHNDVDPTLLRFQHDPYGKVAPKRRVLWSSLDWSSPQPQPHPSARVAF